MSVASRLLVVGSARVNLQPNVKDAVKVGYHVQADLRDRGLSLSDFDAAVHAGAVAPTPDGTPPLTPATHFDEPSEYASFLAEQFGRIAAELPFLFVPGRQGGVGETRRQYSAGYASLDDGSPGYGDVDPGFELLPLDGVRSLGGVDVTSNPRLVDEETVLVDAPFDPALHETFEGRLYIGGGELVGRRAPGLLVPPFAVHDLGPGSDDRLGAYYDVQLYEDGRSEATVYRLGEVSVDACERHADRGELVLLSNQSCPFCRAPGRYFEERLRAVAARRRANGSRARLIDCNSDLRASLDSRQSELFTEFLGSLSRADRVLPDLHRPDGATVEPSDPTRDGLSPWHYAGQRLDLSPADRRAYFARHGVTHPEEYADDGTRPESALPDSDDHAVFQFDQQAYTTGVTQGEWLTFVPERSVDDAWGRVTELVADGTLYDARVATRWTLCARGNDTNYGLFITVPNYLETADVRRVADVIEAESRLPDRTLGFKPLLYSLCGIYGRNKGVFDLPSAIRFSPRDVGSSLTGNDRERFG